MPRWWPARRRDQPQALTVDEVFAGRFGVGSNYSGVEVTEATAFTSSAFWRAISLISGTLAMLPLPTIRDVAPDPIRGIPGGPQTVSSIFDDPDPGGQTQFEWIETQFLHLITHGNAYAWKIYNQAGALVRMINLHPLSVYIELPTPDEYRRGLTDPTALPAGGKWFCVTLADGSQYRVDSSKVFHVPGMSTNGLWGMSLMNYAKTSIGTHLAGDRAAGNLFAKGALISGIISPADDQIDEWDGKAIRRELQREVTGWEHAADVAIINRRLTFTPWTFNPEQAQFLESRQFSIEEVSRWTGVPPHLLMQTDKQSSWGTGIAEQERGMSRTVLAPWANRWESRASREIYAGNRYVRFDFHGLERPTPEIENAQVQANYQGGLITLNEARARLKYPPIPGPAGDAFFGGAPVDPPTA